MIVYKVTNNVNSKVYIGKTLRSLCERWREHCKLSNKCIYLGRAIQKYGKENFTIEKIDVACDEEELNKKEKHWIRFYNSTNSELGYNLTFGGDGCACNEETRRKISISNTGKHHSEETLKKLSKINLEKWQDENYRKHQSEVHKGKVVSEYCKKLSSKRCKARVGEKHPMFGKHLSEEHKRRISETNKGKIGSMRGKHHSEETKRKISESNKGLRLGAKSPSAIAIICVETGEIFDCMKDAHRKTKIVYSNINECCQGKRKSAGGFHWKYYKKESN